jgi:RHS repeat-associated protein
VVTDYQYDGASRLTSLTYRNGAGVLGTLTYGFDAVGSVTAQGGTLARQDLPSPVSSATYTAENRQALFGGASVTYDGEGNATTIADTGGLTTLQWDSRNRLVGLTSPSVTAAFAYDAVGRRTAKTINDSTTRFLYDGPDITQEVAQGQPTSYLRLPFVDAPVSRGASEYYLTDRIGSTLALTDVSGAMTTRYVYEPFGRAQTEGSPSDNALQFTGRENDRTGFYYYRARYYSPSLHRFLGQDLLPGLGGNRYAYAGDGPLGGIDPFGLYTIFINGGSSFGPGGSFPGAGSNEGLVQLRKRLSSEEGAKEELSEILNSGETEAAYAQACARKRAGEPVNLVGHSLGGRAVLAVARQLVSRCGFAPDHVFTIDPFEAPDVKAPPGVAVTNFYQRRSWWFQGPEVGDARANIFVPGYFHSNITGSDIVQDTIEQTIIEGRGQTDPLGGRYK